MHSSHKSMHAINNQKVNDEPNVNAVTKADATSYHRRAVQKARIGNRGRYIGIQLLHFFLDSNELNADAN